MKKPLPFSLFPLPSSLFPLPSSRALRDRRGSALLIVLGMLSFMVISAVAFSIFMRQGRLPSSFLRQRILARELVKAGLAQAMSELDAAIGDAKYPSSTFPGSSNRNYWRNRVYMGVSNTDGPYEDEEEALKQTVSTFPLEGLAYIPPSLVNTVRYWSRRSPSAAWKNLDYDSGRYAFTAVNVSDYLDVNSLQANVMRDSCPDHRISLGYLFENEDHSGWGSVKPSKFDENMTALRGTTYGSLVSLADYNLALSKDASGPLSGIGFKSPFCEYIKSPPSGAEFYVDEDQARQQKFVTDSWFPGTNTANSGILFLTDAKGQPFDGMNESLDDLQKNGSEAFKIFRERLDICTLGALYDYVDEDDVPISLAIPTLERAPALTGIRLTPSGFQVELNPGTVGTKTPGAAAPKQDDEVVTWTIKSLGTDPKITFSACGVFPFKRKSGLSERTSYDVEVHATLFFAEDGTAFDETRRSASDMTYRPANGSWSPVSAMTAKDKAFMTVIGKGKATVRPGALTDSQTVFDITGVEIPFDATAVAGKQVYGVLQKYQLNPNTGAVDPILPATYDATDISDPLYYRAGGKTPTPVVDNLKLKLCFACWVRILGDNGKTVDLVPAMIDDDQGYNGHNSGTLSEYEKICGTKTPLLPISTGVLLDLSSGNFTGTGSYGSSAAQSNVDQGSLAIYCDDPRYNWAPEDWYQSPNGDVQGSVWLNAAKARCDGNDRRQNDSIFQFVSDQGFLQSMGELQFLPYVTSFARKQDPFSGAFFNAGKYDGQPFAKRTGVDALANKNYAWKTHWGFGEFADHEKDGEDCCPYEWGIEDTDGGAAVNPYADGDLFLAALANTPYDYIVAAEDEDNEKKLEDNIDLCFNARSSEAKVTWVQLKAIAEQIKKNFNTGEEWEEWADWDTDDFFGQKLPNFDDVDRKFLFSYWKQCFANRQQLFLVFVRAEPTVIGGSGMGHTPSQLGARAVALVWREPVSSIGGTAGSAVGEKGANTSSSAAATAPHRMRILFYHQFE